MLTKLLIFVLLGSTLVLAAPRSNTIEIEIERRGDDGSLLNHISNWWYNVKSKMSDVMDKLKKSFDQVINEQGPKYKEMGKEKLAEMEKKYKELQAQAREAVDKERNSWNYRIEQWKKDGGEKLEDGKEKLEDLKRQAQEALQKQTDYWNAKYQDWEQSIRDSVPNKP